MFAHSLRSFVLVAHFVHSSLVHSLCSFTALSLTHFVCSLLALACSLSSFIHCAFTHSLCSFVLGTCFVRAFVTHLVRSSLAHSLRSFAALSLTHFVRSLALCCPTILYSASLYTISRAEAVH